MKQLSGQKDKDFDIYGGREFGSKFEKFEYWMTNFFWYHYKWAVIVLLFIGVVLISWVVYGLSSRSYDWEVVCAAYGEYDKDALEDYAERLIYEATGEKQSVRVTGLELKDGDERLLTGPLTDYEYVLFFVDEKAAELYGSLNYFEEVDGKRFRYVEELGLYAAVNDAEYVEHDASENNYSTYDEAELKDLNMWMSEAHDDDVEKAKTIIATIK